MTHEAILDKLLWGSVGGLLVIGLALFAGRISQIHPAAKTVICRLAMVKLLASLFVLVPVAAKTVPSVAGLSLGAASWVILGFWACGVLVVLLHAIRAYTAAERLRKLSAPITAPLGSAVPIAIPTRSLAGLAEPCVVGLFRPCLLLPEHGSVQPSVIRHELAHIRHLDTLFGLVAWLAYAAFWFLPGMGKLVSEHALWQEAWADLDARAELKIKPDKQAHELLSALEGKIDLPAVALGFRGDSRHISRRITAMFVSRHSVLLSLALVAAVSLSAIPVRPLVPESTAPTFSGPVAGPA